MRRLVTSSALLIALTAATASAQISSGQGGEVVVTADGQLTPPWIEKSVCDEDVCRLIVFNPETHEIARLNGRLTSAFALSGAGHEVVRVPR